MYKLLRVIRSDSSTYSSFWIFSSNRRTNSNMGTRLPLRRNNHCTGVPPYSLYHYTTILYYTILYCIILCYTILYYTILYYTILYYTILYYTILCYAMLCYAMLYGTILYYTILYYRFSIRMLSESGASIAYRQSIA